MWHHAFIRQVARFRATSLGAALWIAWSFAAFLSAVVLALLLLGVLLALGKSELDSVIPAVMGFFFMPFVSIPAMPWTSYWSGTGLGFITLLIGYFINATIAAVAYWLVNMLFDRVDKQKSKWGRY